MPEPLGDLQAFPRRGDNHFDSDRQPGEHVDETVNAEEVDAAPDQITHARLRYTQKSGGLGLLQSPGLQRLLDLDEQASAHPEVLGLSVGESDIRHL